MKGRSRLRVAGSVMGVAAGLAAFGVGSPAFASSSNFLKNLFYGGAPPPSAPDAPPEVDCPAVTIAEGGAALRSYTGGRTGSPEALRNQLSIINVARECVGRRDGSIVVKVGVEGQALIGPAGSSGQFDTPVRIVLKRGDRVLANRARRATVAVPPGQMHGSFVVVEEGIVVPPNTGDFDIEVALGGSGPVERPARGARR
jgi:hypothetical protein